MTRKNQKEIYDLFCHRMNDILKDDDQSKVTAVSARCGVGKSTYIKELIQNTIDSDCTDGLIVITDSIERNEDYISGLDKSYQSKIAVLNSGNIYEQKHNQKRKKVLIMTTQRYFRLSREEIIDFTNYYGGKRTKIIFDEQPYFLESITIDYKMLSAIDSALYKGLDDTVDQVKKKWIIAEFETFKSLIKIIMDDYERSNNKEQFCLWQKPLLRISTDDDRFFEIIDSYKSAINSIDIDAYKNLNAIKYFVLNGGVFQYQKHKTGEYNKSFNLVIDNKDKLLNLGAKVFVLDATADITPLYKLPYIKLITLNELNVSLDNLTIDCVNVTTSRNTIVKGTVIAKSIYKAVVKQINQIDKNNLAIFSYVQLEDKLKDSFPSCLVGHFGNLRGYNCYRECKTIAQIGLNRFSPLTYFLTESAIYPDKLDKIKAMPKDKMIQSFDYILDNKRQVTNETLNNSILADLEQNIFRCALRDIDCTDNIRVVLFFNTKRHSDLVDMIEKRYGRYGATINLVDTPIDLKVDKAARRKQSHGMTNAQKVLKWLDAQTTGRMFKVKDVRDETQLTENQWKNLLKDNNGLRDKFRELQTNKKGIYQIC